MKESVKTHTLLFIVILAASSAIMAQPVSAQAIPKPAAPTFSVYLVNHPYYVPEVTPAYTIDPYTGTQKQTVQARPGYMVDNVSIELWVLNTAHSYFDGQTTYLPYINVRTKGHFEEKWTEVYPTFQGLHTGNYNDSGVFIPNGTPPQSSQQYTVIQYSSTAPPYYKYPPVSYPPNATVDWQVSVMIGHASTKFFNDHPLLPPPMLVGHTEPAIAFDIQGDWSNTQTLLIAPNSTATTPDNPTAPASTPITIPSPSLSPTSSATPSATPNPSPTIPELPAAAIIPLLAATLAIAAIAKMRKPTPK